MAFDTVSVADCNLVFTACLSVALHALGMFQLKCHCPTAALSAGGRRVWPLKPRAVCIGRAGFRATTGSSPTMDHAIWELFGGELGLPAPPEAVPVAPVVYVYVDPRCVYWQLY